MKLNYFTHQRNTFVQYNCYTLQEEKQFLQQVAISSCINLCIKYIIYWLITKYLTNDNNKGFKNFILKKKDSLTWEQRDNKKFVVHARGLILVCYCS